MRYLSVRNFERFQHYKDRRPPWIKFYVDLLEDEELAALPVQTRLLYCLLLLVAALKDNRFPANAVWISEEVKMPVADVKRSVSVLLASGHLYHPSASQSASTGASTVADKAASEVASEVASPRARTRSVSVSVSVSSPSKVTSERGLGETAIVALRPRDELWDALEAELGSVATKSERGRRNKAIQELREIDASAADVRVKVAEYRRRWPSVELTATALVSNWSQLERPAPAQSGGVTSRELIDAAWEEAR